MARKRVNGNSTDTDCDLLIDVNARGGPLVRGMERIVYSPRQEARIHGETRMRIQWSPEEEARELSPERRVYMQTKCEREWQNQRWRECWQRLLIETSGLRWVEVRNRFVRVLEEELPYQLDPSLPLPPHSSGLPPFNPRAPHATEPAAPPATPALRDALPVQGQASAPSSLNLGPGASVSMSGGASRVMSELAGAGVGGPSR